MALKCPVCRHHCVIDLGQVSWCRHCEVYAANDRETTIRYDAEYVASRYDRYPTTEAMTELRLRVMETVIHLAETLPQGEPLRYGRLLDVGYGNGSFIRGALRRGWDAYGYDVNPTEYRGVRRVPWPKFDCEHYRAITFFDSLEHFEGLEPARGLADHADWIFLSMPLPPYYFLTANWKHLRPGEHHFYFQDPKSFEPLFSSERAEAKVVYTETPEDTIRGRLSDGLPNIQTVALRVHREKGG